MPELVRRALGVFRARDPRRILFGAGGGGGGGIEVGKAAIYSRTTQPSSVNEKTDHPNLKGVGIMLYWSDWETANNTWSASIDADIRASIADAKSRGYSLVIRVMAGSDSPSWIYTDATNPVKRAWTLSVEPGADPGLQSIPVADDANYVLLYGRMLQRLDDIINEQIPTTSSFGYDVVAMVTTSGPTGYGSEMTQSYGSRLSTAHATVPTLSAASVRGSSTLSLSADPGAGWPSGATQFLVRVLPSGTTWTNENDTNRGAYNFPVAIDDFENRTAAAGSLGRNRNGYDWAIGGGSSSLVSVSGGAALFTTPAPTGSAFIARSTLNARTMQDGDWELEFQISALPAANTCSVSVIAREASATPGNDCYLGTLTRTTTNTRLAINKRVGGVETTLAANVNLGTALDINVPWIIRLKTTNVGGDVQLKCKAWRKSDTEPTGWTHEITELAAAVPHTAAGKIGWHASNSGSNTSAITFSIRNLIAGPSTTNPFLLLVTRSGATLTVAQKDWSGTFAADMAVGSNVQYVNDANVDTTQTIDGVLGARSMSAYNYGAWELIIPGEVARRDRWRDAWARCVDLHASTFHSQVKVGFAAGTIFLDDWRRARQLAEWAGNNSSVLPAVTGETGAAAFNGTLPAGGYGTRILATTTNLREDDDWSPGSTQSNISWLRLASASGMRMKGHTSAMAETANGDPLIKALEAFLKEFPTCHSYETSSARFDDAVTTNTAATATWEGWTGGSGRTGKQYLIDDAGSLQNRLTG